jgi:hypothetical protein
MRTEPAETTKATEAPAADEKARAAAWERQKTTALAWLVGWYERNPEQLKALLEDKAA